MREETNPAVEAKGISKSFGGALALDGVDLELRKGEVHALLGENGAGKTTLSNIIAGLYRADSGTLLVDGVETHFHSPLQAIDAGIGMVHQHFRLVAPMTVAENLHLGSPDTPAIVSQKRLVAGARRMMEEIGLEVDPTARIWQLSVGEQQRVEILRVLARGARVLILDEPTAVLTSQEAKELFAVIRKLVDGGRTVVFISHKLNEVLEISDRITVLRGGKHVITRDAAGATARELARLMTGSSGNGQRELTEVITGLRHAHDGSITIDGQDTTRGSTRDISELGVGHIPEDRIGVGMAGASSVRDNAVLRHYRKPELSTRVRLRRPQVLEFAKRLVETARVQTRSVAMPAGQMSGGNQQRLVARREAMISDNLLVAAHPTRGLDVLAAKEVQAAIVERRDSGCAVLMVSDDLDEVMLMSNRIAVMYEGRIMGVFDRSEFDRERIGLLMGGQQEEVAR